MQTTLERPEAPVRHRFDVDDYYRMAEVGILSREDRVELIEGGIVDMAPIGSAHGGTVVALTELVARAVADGKVLVSVQGPLRLDPHNEPQPDLMLLRPRADRYREATPPRPTCCCWSRWRTARSLSIAAPNSRFMRGMVFPRCGSSICPGMRSRSTASRGRRDMPSEVASPRVSRSQSWCQRSLSTSRHYSHSVQECGLPWQKS